MDAEDAIRDFVEGRIDLGALQSLSVSDARISAFLASSDAIAPYSGFSSTNLDYLLALDPARNDDRLNAQDLLSQLLSRLGVAHVPCARYEEISRVMHKVQPKWLDMDARMFDQLLREAGDRKGDALVAWLKDGIRQRYRYEGAPPKWLQGPQWPHQGTTPLKFIGQRNLESRHDRARAYDFVDESSGALLTITQVA